MPYGFDINVGGDMLAEMQKMYTAMVGLSGKVEEGTQQIKRNFRETSETIKEVGMHIAEAFALHKIYEFGKELVNLTAEFEGFENVIRYSSRSSIDAADNLNYVHGAIDRLHLPMQAAIQGFSEMQAGLIGTGIEGEKLRRLFEGISTAGTVLHLGANAQQMILYDFKEIGERGLNMRNMRSLMGWLPGISEIVKETFHKTFTELEAEHMSGPAFLDKLGGGLQKHFAPGLPNAGNSLMAAVNDMNTAVTKLKLELGENLRPLFIQIMNDVKKAFDSGPMKWFVANIHQIADTVLTLIKLWAEYKIGIMAANIVSEAWIAIQSAMALAAGKTKIEIEGASLSLEGFQKGLNTFNTGFLAMGIGAAVELFMKFQAHAKHAKEAYEALIESDTGAGGIGGQVNEQKNRVDQVRALMGDSTLMKDQRYRDDLLNRAGNIMKDIQEIQTGTIAPHIQHAQSLIDSSWAMPLDQKKDLLGGIAADRSNATAADALIKSLKDLITELRKRGAKTPNYGGMGAVGDNAFSTSHLAGANGGLGEAKVVQIHFHAPFQQNIVPTKDALTREGNAAIQGMLRMLNNVALSQSTTQ